MKKKVSIITPCYNEEDNVEECYNIVKKLMADNLPNYDYEHLFCDNASLDNTVDILKRIAEKDKNVKIIVNSRNYGPFNSTFNALLNTSGDCIVVMLPVDLQDPPEIIVDFVSKWEQGYDVVYGIRNKRKESVIMRNVRRLYYRVVTRLSSIYIPPDVGEFQLIDKKILEALRKTDDYYPYIRGMIANCGYRATGIEYTWQPRKHGFSKNKLYNLIDQGLNGLISFSNIPLRICMFSGFFLSGLSILCAFVQLILNLVLSEKMVPAGIPTLIVALFFFSGIQLFFIGVLGEYVGAIHSQVRKKPLVLEKERINFEKQ